MNLFATPQEGCVAWQTTLQKQVNAIPQQSPTNIALVGYSNATSQAEIALDCIFIQATGSGQQKQIMRMRAMCGSMFLNATNARTSGCVPQTDPRGATGVPSVPGSLIQVPSVLGGAQTKAGVALSSILDKYQALSEVTGLAQSANASQPASAGSSGYSGQPINSNSAVPATGTFRSDDLMVTSYGCLRATERLLCDFDVIKLNSQAVNSVQLLNTLNLVANGGQIIPHGSVYYVDPSGKPFAQGFLSAKPVRFVVEFPGVGPQTNSIAFLNGQTVVEGIPILPVAAGQTEGTVPLRTSAAVPIVGQPLASSTQPAQQSAASPRPPAVAPQGNALDTVNSTVDKTNNAMNKLNDVKNKAKVMLNSLGVK